MKRIAQRKISRRKFVEEGIAGGFATVGLRSLGSWQRSGEDPYRGFRMCLGTVCLKHFPGPEAAAKRSWTVEFQRNRP